MKKVLALVVAVFVLAAAGSALAAGHDPVPVTPTPDPTPAADEVVTEYEQIGTATPVTVTVIKVEIANVPTLAQIIQAVTAAVQAAIENNTAIRAMGTLRTNANIVEVADSTSAADKMANAQARLASLGGNRTAIGALPPMRVRESGAQPITLPKFNEKFYGLAPRIDLFGRSKSSSLLASVKTAAEGETVFLNSSGDQVSVIPDGSNGEEAGMLTAVVQMEAGEVYDPAISVSEAEASSVLSASDYEAPQTVSVPIYASEATKRTPYFSTSVPDAVMTAFAAKFGSGYEEIPADAVGGSFDTKLPSSTSEAWEYAQVNQMPLLSLDNGSYIAQISFDLSDIRGETLYEDELGDIIFFFPFGAAGRSTVADYTLVDANMTEVYDASEIVATKPYYIAFTVSNGSITAAKTEFSPVLLTRIATGEEEPSYGGGGSSGCSTGFSALALAVLGGLFALRRKQ
ncbi:MAG: hypothetical protein IJT21_06240 [Synergistaceae bacterium]|nr:hypothetical protein [Synergistaceae bacterium]